MLNAMKLLQIIGDTQLKYNSFLGVAEASSVPEVYGFGRVADTFDALTPGITGNGGKLAFSPGLQFVAHGGTVYKRTVNDFEDLEVSVGTINAFSPDGQYLVGMDGSDNFYFYSISGDTFTELTNPGTIPEGCTSISWSPTGEYVLFTGDYDGTLNPETSQIIQDPLGLWCYVLDGDFLTLLTGGSRPTPPGGTSPVTFLSSAWSADGQKLAVGFDTELSGEYITIYNLSGGSTFFTQGIISGSFPINSDATALKFIGNNRLIIGIDTSSTAAGTFRSLYVPDNREVEATPNFSAVNDDYPSVAISSIACDNQGNIAFGYAGSPYLEMYTHNNNQLAFEIERATDPSSMPASNVTSVALHPPSVAGS